MKITPVCWGYPRHASQTLCQCFVSRTHENCLNRCVWWWELKSTGKYLIHAERQVEVHGRDLVESYGLEVEEDWWRSGWVGISTSSDHSIIVCVLFSVLTNNRLKWIRGERLVGSVLALPRGGEKTESVDGGVRSRAYGSWVWCVVAHACDLDTYLWSPGTCMWSWDMPVIPTVWGQQGLYSEFQASLSYSIRFYLKNKAKTIYGGRKDDFGNKSCAGNFCVWVAFESRCYLVWGRSQAVWLPH